jgi:Tfp pilus assembly protein PilO
MMQLRKFLRTYQGMIGSILILVGVLLGVFLGVIPAIKKVIELRSEALELQTLDEQLRQKVSILDSSDEETYKTYLTDLAVAVPTDKSLTSVFSTIDGLASLTGVTLSDFTLTKPGAIASASAAKLSVEEKQIGTNLLPFTLTVTGSYEQIREFLSQVVQVRRFFRVRYFNIAFTTTGALSARMGMDAFYASLPSNLGSAEQPLEALSQTDEETIKKISAFPILASEAQVPIDPLLPPTTTSREDPFAP